MISALVPRCAVRLPKGVSLRWSRCGEGEAASTPVLTVAHGPDADGLALPQWSRPWAPDVKWHQRSPAWLRRSRQHRLPRLAHVSHKESSFQSESDNVQIA